MERLFSTLKKYGCIIALTMLILTVVLQLWQSNIRQYPLYNEADGLLSQMVVRINAGAGLTKNDPRAGFPFGAKMSDFPVFLTHLYSNTFYKVSSLFTANWILIENLHFLLSFFLTAVITLYILEKMGIITPFAMLGSLLYTFLPWHFIRVQMGHYSYLDYFVVPVLLFYVWQLSQGQHIFDSSNHYRNRHNMITVLGLLACGSVNIYFSFFGCCFLGISMLFHFYRKKAALWGEAFAGLLIIGLENLVFLVPYMLQKSVPGMDYLNVYRNPAELRTYALNISGMLLPIEDHRLSVFASLRDFFTDSFKTGTYDALGIFAAAGVLAGVFFLFRKETEENKGIKTASVLMVIAIFIACTDGFNEIIGLFFSSVRAYTRISIFIAFLAIFIIVSLAGQLYKKWEEKKYAKKMVWIVCLAAIAVGVADQTSAEYVPDYADIREEYISDREFMKNMDFEGSVVFQMPYVSFPEMPPINRMKDYELLKGYLYTDKAAFSYGVLKDSAGDRWNQWMMTLTIPEQLLVLATSGYNGIYVDSFAYQEEECRLLTDTLKELLASSPVVSRNGRLYYFSMQNYLNHYEQKYSEEEKEYLTNLYRKVTGFRLKKGFYQKRIEEDGRAWTAGAGKKARISLYNADRAETEVVLHMKLTSADRRQNTVDIQYGGSVDTVRINETAAEYSKKLTIPPGTTDIVLYSKYSGVKNEQGEKICFYLEDVVLESTDSYAVVEY